MKTVELVLTIVLCILLGVITFDHFKEKNKSIRPDQMSCEEVNAFVSHYGDPRKEVIEVLVKGKYVTIHHKD